jgi:hypothetical protein
VVVVFGVADVAYDLGTVAKMTDRFLHADAHVRDNERWEKAHVFPIEVEHDARILLREPGNCPKKHPTRH